MDKKKQVNYYLHRIYALCKKDIRVIIKRVRKNTAGLTNCIDTIIINPKKDIIPTFIHECLHILYPAWSETKIIRWENKIINNISIKQINNLLILMMLSILNSYDDGEDD